MFKLQHTDGHIKHLRYGVYTATIQEPGHDIRIVTVRYCNRPIYTAMTHSLVDTVRTMEAIVSSHSRGERVAVW